MKIVYFESTEGGMDVYETISDTEEFQVWESNAKPGDTFTDKNGVFVALNEDAEFIW